MRHLYVYTVAGQAKRDRIEHMIHTYPDGFSIVVRNVKPGCVAALAKPGAMFYAPVEVRQLPPAEFERAAAEATRRNAQVCPAHQLEAVA